MKRLSTRTFWTLWLGLPLVTWFVATPLLTVMFARYGVETPISEKQAIVFYGDGKHPVIK